MRQLSQKRWVMVTAFLVLMINTFLLGPRVRADDVVNVIQQEEKKNNNDENLTKFVLLITIDGLGEKPVTKGYAPNVNGLAGSGVKTTAISTFPANTYSALASILTGTLPPDHKYTGAGTRSQRLSLPDQIAQNKQSAVVIDGKNGASKGLINKAKLITDNKGDKSTTDIAIKEFETKKPYFMHVILPGVAKAENKYGPDSAEYIKAVQEADKQVGRLLDKLHEYGLYQYSIVVVSGSYGVNGVLVPLYMKGPTINAGITTPVASLTNIAPTVSYILGMKNENQDNQILWDILKNEGGSSESYLLKRRIKDMADQLIETARREYQLENEQLAVNKEKNSLQQEKGQVKDIINAKDKEIRKVKIKITVYKIIGIITLVLLGIGYIYEYKFLKRKFLIFK